MYIYVCTTTDLVSCGTGAWSFESCFFPFIDSAFFFLLLFCLIEIKLELTHNVHMYACMYNVHACTYIHVHTYHTYEDGNDRPSLSAGHKFPDLAQRRKVSSGIM